MTKSIAKKDKSLIALIIFALISIVLLQIQPGRIILYPFIILGTWFHEMGHGLTSLFLGANFERLQLFANGSGIAVYTGSPFLGRIGMALIAAAGPIGPILAGSLFVAYSGTAKAARIVLTIVGVVMLISALIWVRPLISFGFFFVLLFGIILLWIALKSGNRFQRPILLFLGVQAWLSLYLSFGYLFSDGGYAGGSSFASDTQVIARALLLPYWVWGAVILIFSIYIIFYTLKKTYKF